MTTQYISVTDTAKLIRKALAESFPGIKFGVRSSSYAGGASIQINWTDGPTATQVESIAKLFQGASFDGMQDLKSYHSVVFDGRLTHFGGDYVFCTRTLSPDLLTRSIAAIGRRFGIAADRLPTQDEYRTGKLHSRSTPEFGGQWDHRDWSSQVSRDAYRRTRVAGPKPSPTLSRFGGPRDQGQVPAATRAAAPAAVMVAASSALN